MYTKNGHLAIRFRGQCSLVSLEAFKVCCRRGLDPCEGQPKCKPYEHDAQLGVQACTGRHQRLRKVQVRTSAGGAKTEQYSLDVFDNQLIPAILDPQCLL
ncbi:Hypothetical protein HDN1F_17740 [gamma proteobacterium HdN1]|nr:Hypothetical protein HDN1F_17740 [gamma proteobacterium HdN1]